MSNKKLDNILDKGLTDIIKGYNAYRRVVSGRFPLGKTRLKQLEYRLKNRLRTVLDEQHDSIWDLHCEIKLNASRIEYSKSKTKRDVNTLVDDFDLTNSKFEASA